MIDVRPGLTYERFLHVFCHECGHVKTLWDEWSGDVPDYEPNSLSMPDSFRTAGIVQAIEDDADRLAREWMDYADLHADKYKGDWLVSRLRALANYSEPVLLPISEAALLKAVDAGVAQAMKQVRQNWEG